MRPILVVNPADDRIFSAYADVLVEHGAGTTGELQRRLRPIYTQAVVRARELSSEPFVIWYVYRDGRWINSSPPPRAPEGRPDDVRSAR